MRHPCLPLEVCELIVDSVPEQRRWWEVDDEEDSSFTFRMCALTCSDWLPRARVHLYRTLNITSSLQLDKVLTTLAVVPDLAKLVHRLHVPYGGKYIPFAQPYFVKQFCNLRSLNYVYRTPGAIDCFPHNHHLLVARFPLTELVIEGDLQNLQRSWCKIFRLIWSLRELESLKLNVASSSSLTDAEIQLLSTARRAWSCAQLKRLVLVVSSIAPASRVCIVDSPLSRPVSCCAGQGCEQCRTLHHMQLLASTGLRTFYRSSLVTFPL